MPMKTNTNILFRAAVTRAEFDLASSRILPPRLLSSAFVVPESQWAESKKTSHYVANEGGQKVLIEFFPAVRLNGEYIIEELYAQQINDDEFFLMGKARKTRKMKKSMYTSYGARPAYSSLSPWSSGGCASSPIGGCFSGALALVGLLFLVAIIACLFGACDLLNLWCPCLFEKILDWIS